jgi:hypothetical protein
MKDIKQFLNELISDLHLPVEERKTHMCYSSFSPSGFRKWFENQELQDIDILSEEDVEHAIVILLMAAFRQR